MILCLFVIYVIIRILWIKKKKYKATNKILNKILFYISAALPIIYWIIWRENIFSACVFSAILLIIYIILALFEDCSVINMVNIFELLLIGIPSALASYHGLMTSVRGDTINFLFWTILWE